MSKSLLEFLSKTHSRFLTECRVASKFDSRPITALPTIIFAVGSFLFTYMVIYKEVFPGRSWKLQLYRIIGFHWTFFYAMRIWFLLLKILRWITACLTIRHRALYGFEKNATFTPVVYHNLMLLLLFFISSIPCFFIFLTVMSRRNMTNFLMWVGEDPWLRTEIGLAGHLLNRAPIPSRKRRSIAYRCHRSSSCEHRESKELPPKKCKSELYKAEDMLSYELPSVRRRRSAQRLKSFGGNKPLVLEEIKKRAQINQ